MNKPMTFDLFTFSAITDYAAKSGDAHHAFKKLAEPHDIFATAHFGGAELLFKTPVTIQHVIGLALPIANRYGVDFRGLAFMNENEKADPLAFFVRQTELTDEQLRQQDAVDALVLRMINAAHEALGLEFIDHDIDAISVARDVLVEFLTNEGHVDVANDFYAELTEQEEY